MITDRHRRERGITRNRRTSAVWFIVGGLVALLITYVGRDGEAFDVLLTIAIVAPIIGALLEIAACVLEAAGER